VFVSLLGAVKGLFVPLWVKDVSYLPYCFSPFSSLFMLAASPLPAESFLFFCTSATLLILVHLRSSFLWWRSFTIPSIKCWLLESGCWFVRSNHLRCWLLSSKYRTAAAHQLTALSHDLSLPAFKRDLPERGERERERETEREREREREREA